MPDTPETSPKPRRRWWKITLIAIAAVLVLVVGGAAIYFKWAGSRAYPVVEGTITVSGLDGPVEVIRDEMGIPHIYATTTHDLFMAQGFVHAQDRFWQMDVWRHIGAGTLSAMFGSDQVEDDAFIRTMGWGRLAEAQYEAADDQSKVMLDAYAEGVNAYIGDRAPGALSFEYTILKLAVNRGYEPEPWTPANTLTWGKVMAWDLGGNFRAEIDRALLLADLTSAQVDQLWPPYPGDRNPYIAADRSTAARASHDVEYDAEVREALAAAADNIDGLYALTGGGFEGIGSNSWAVSGTHTDTGAPMLMNDPHLGIRIPSIWYQVGLHCVPVSSGCPYDVAGFSFAGVPGVIIGHNADIAWGFTNLGPDVMDLYIERINPENPNQYEFRGEWVDMDVRTETISVAGGEDETIEVRTTRHGPIISGRFEPLDDFDGAGIELPEPYAVALRWTALDPSPSIVAFIDGLDQASNWDEFRDAASLFDVPSQNLLYADTAGNIGYQSPGLIPIRAAGDGRYPAPGWTGTHEWTGWIPFDELPSVLNPDSGYIVTANNAVIDDAYPYLLTEDWAYGYRARRIVDLVASNPGIGLEDHGLIQFDNYDLNAERLIPFVFAAAGTQNDRAGEALETLVEWDLQNDASSSGAAVWNATWRRVLALTFHDDLPEDQWPSGGSRWFAVMHDLVDSPTDPFWDDRTTGETERRDDILRRAFELAVADLQDMLGGDVTDWSWGDLHTSTFENETLGQSGIGLIEDRFNRGAFPTSGGESIVNATGWTATEGFFVDWLPSMRMRVDLGDLSRSVALHTTGQSGHADHPHYDDMIPMWLEGETYPMLWTRADVEARAKETLVLEP